jgi:hypothetical protein
MISPERGCKGSSRFSKAMMKLVSRKIKSRPPARKALHIAGIKAIPPLLRVLLCPIDKACSRASVGLPGLRPDTDDEFRLPLRHLGGQGEHDAMIVLYVG